MNQRVIKIKLDIFVTNVLKSIWSDVYYMRDGAHLLVPLACYYGSEGRALYNALRETKRALYIEGSSLVRELDDGIAWARGIHCAQPRALWENAETDSYYTYMKIKHDTL